MSRDSPAMLVNRSGELIGERYELKELFASGGQGHIYRARDRTQGDWVAIKVLKDEYAQDVQWRERMFREARALCTLSGTSAVRVFDQRWTADGALCIVMEWLEGADLETRLIQLETEGQRASLSEVARLFRPVVQTLEVAHQNAIIHRDLKPANIYVLNDGSVRLLDFGFAKFERLIAMTQIGQVAGSPSYLAPECWRGDSSILDRRVDVYGLAAVIYRCLAGAPPFEGSAVKLLKLVTTAERPKLTVKRPDLPKVVDDWVGTALAIEPDARFDSVAAMWNAFQLALRLQGE